MPSPRLPAAATHYPAFENTELTWSGPITDFPLVDVKAPKAKPSPRGEPDAKPLPPEGAEAFHPRQRIYTDPCARRIPAKRWSIPPLPRAAKDSSQPSQYRAIPADSWPRAAASPDWPGNAFQVAPP